jgi:hypothetical protein
MDFLSFIYSRGSGILILENVDKFIFDKDLTSYQYSK